jgi:hypothetical protein
MSKTKYITIIELDNKECSNVGTITTTNLEKSFSEAIESHFDATLIRYRFKDKDIKSLGDCIDAYPIIVIVDIDNFDEEVSYELELSETWLY